VQAHRLVANVPDRHIQDKATLGKDDKGLPRKDAPAARRTHYILGPIAVSMVARKGDWCPRDSILDRSPARARPELAGPAAEQAGCLDSGLMRAEYMAPAGSVRLHRPQTTRGTRLLPNAASRSSPTSAVLPLFPFRVYGAFTMVPTAPLRAGYAPALFPTLPRLSVEPRPNMDVQRPPGGGQHVGFPADAAVLGDMSIFLNY
jgi:hypothetical protein